MFFIRSKLASMLRPWLLAEPDLELKLGFLRSSGSAKNLRFDISVLNQLISESNCLSFKDVRVENLSFRVSSWETTDDEYSRHTQSSISWSIEETKKILSVIDPEGTSLHNIIEKIAAITPARNQLSTSLMNVILKLCQLQMHDIHLEVQLPVVDGSIALFEIKELSIEASRVDNTCLLGTLTRCVFVPERECSLVINAIGVGIELKIEDHASSVFYSSDIVTTIKLKDLQVLNLEVRAPQSDFAFCPVDLPILLAFDNLIPKEVKPSRNGRELWNIAASRVGYLTSNPRSSLLKVVNVVGLWLRYVHAYESLLLLLGYSTETKLKKSAIRMSVDKKFFTRVKHQCKVITEIEKALPVEALARARRVARYRAAMRIQRTQPFNSEPFIEVHRIFIFIKKILSLLSFIWESICGIFKLVICFFSVKNTLNQHQEIDERSAVVSEDFSPHYCFSLVLGKISIAVYPINSVLRAVSGNKEPHIGITDMDLRSFCMVLDTLFLVYVADSTTQSLSLSCGDFKVNSSSSSINPLRDRSLTKETNNNSTQGRRKEKIHESSAVIWSEPAIQFLLSDKVATESANSRGSAWFLHLESYLEELWSNWKIIRKELEGSKAQFWENPFLLCEIKRSLMVPCLHRPDYGLWRCCLTMGKLNFDLGYSSITSFALLLRQIEHTLCWTAIKRTRDSSCSPNIGGEPKQSELEDYYESYANGMKMMMLRMIPEKNIQVGVAIAGPTIRMVLQEDGLLGSKEQYRTLTQGHGDILLAFDLENIELAVWPTQETSPPPLTGEPRLDNAGTEHLRAKKPRLIHILKEDLDVNYISEGQITLDSCLRFNGLNAYFEDIEENRRCPVIVLKPVIIQSSSCKEYLDSLSTTVSTLSTSLCGMANGVSVLSYMDELWVVFQVVECILSTVSYSFASLDCICGVHFEEIIGNKNASGKEDTNGFTEAYEAKGATLILKSTQFVLDATFDFGPLDIILDNSRKTSISENSMKVYGASSSKKLPTPDVPEHGIGVSIQHSHVHISSEEGIVKLLIDFLGIKSVIFKCESLIGECITSHVDALSSEKINDAVHGSTSGSKISTATNDPPSTILTDDSHIQPYGFNQILGHQQLTNSSILAPSKSYELLINVEVGEIFMAENSIKNALMEGHQPNRLLSSLSIGGDFHTISWTIQGGLVVLETEALAMFLCCFNVYFLCITNLSSIIPSLGHLPSGRQSETVQPGEGMATLSNYPSTVSSFSQSETSNTSPESKWQLLGILNISLIQFSVVLVVAEGSGRIWELMLEADFHLNLDFKNLRRKLLFDNSRLMILSQRLIYRCAEQTMNDIHVPHFSSVTIKEMSSHSSSGDPSLSLQHMDTIPTGFRYAFSSSAPDPQEESKVENDVPGYSHLSRTNCIVKHVAVSLMMEKTVTGDEVDFLWLKNNWVGNGSVSGLDLTISLSEIQMLLSLVAPLSGVSSVESTGKSKPKHLSRNHEPNSDSVDAVPDGAVVALQDIHQHMYFAVEDSESKYRLTGAIHYSLVGERALFRVKHCSRKRWGLPVSGFTLISLHAKSSSGEPLRLNYRPGSGFVDISSIDDDGSALWSTLSYKPESYEGDSDLESYVQSSKNTFYLVNKKCNCAVAFIDGVPEFVEKPGNPFKLKVFHYFSLARDASSLGTPLGRPYEIDQQQNRDVGEEETSSQAHPYLNITIDKVSLTIVHEVPDANDKFPLLQGCINNIQFIVQVLSSKVRLISTFTVVICHFDAQSNLWREIVQPVEMCMFYRSKFVSQGSEIVPQGVPVHFYFRMNQVDVYLTELSLDILLFMVGELNLAGPYAVRSSRIFANCCKVENQSGLNLLCHFYDNQDATIAGKQSTLIFLRHATSASRLPEKSSFVSVQLATLGAFSTSPIHVSLLNAQILAWRTRVVSLQDSRSFPGPFIVVEISKKTEDGLSIVVSPLLRIHNETGYSMTLRFRRPQQEEAESASVVLRSGDTVDDSMAALDAINLNGGSKKALMSLNLGNFLFSFKPEVSECFGNYGEPISIEWSEDLKGGKAVRLSGVFDKLSYKFRRTLGVESVKYSFGTVRCSVNVEGAHLTDLHFLIQTIGRDVPVIRPDNFGETAEMRTSPVALQEQKEIFLLPTVHVSNFVQSEIHVLITETHPDLGTSGGGNNTGKEATIPCGSSACLYGNPAMIYFTVTLTAFSSRCNPVNSGDWVKKLHKQKHNTHFLDIDLDFGGGKYFASLRLLRGDRGILEAAVFTSYKLHNGSDHTLFCFIANQKPLSRGEADRLGSNLSPERGTLLPPQSTKSWFLKSNKVQLILLEEKASAALLDLDALSRFTELCLEVHEGAGIKHITKLGVSLNPCQTNVVVPSQIVSLVPRYVVSNESQVAIIVRQCYLEDDRHGIISVNSKQRAALDMKSEPSKRRVIGSFDSLFRKHRNANEDSLMSIQFCLDEIGWSWSGPICVASLGRFFLKFRRSLDSPEYQSNPTAQQENKLIEFAVVHVVEEGSTLVLRFHWPPNISLPYRIENFLRDASITYYQKDSLVPEILGSGSSVNYVWDDLSLPHKLVVHIPDMRLSREINIEKVREWRPLLKVQQHRGLALHLPLDKKPGDQRRTRDESYDLEMVKVGYEVYTDGPTRVLRVSEFPDSSSEDAVFQPCAKIQLRVSNFLVHLLEHGKQDEDAGQPSSYSPLIIARLGNINLDSMFTDQHKYNQIKIQSLIVDEKWAGAPFAAMLRRDQLNYSEMKGNILQIVFTLLSTNSNVRQVNYASIVLQPVDLNLDEETLTRLVPFWRTSLSDSKAPSQQFYFKHFEIHPVKIVASFLPGSSDSSYSSAQETLRSLLHSVIKIPSIKNMDVELNGILVTHALVTARELFIKCAQHYSWYAMRAVYIAKGSPLLPPSFASIFDDSASSSLDVFFDPSSGLINLPGVTLGMFKFISKSISKKGFSGTKRYFGDLGKTMKTAGSNVLFAAVTEISDCILRGAEANGFNGMVNGFHQGILKLAMEPSLLGTAVMEGGPDRKIKLDRSPGVDELYIEGYLQAMLDALYKQEYLRVRVIDDQVVLKNLPPNTSLINEIMDRVNSFLVSKGLLKGELPTSSRSLRHLRGESEWKIGPTVLTLWEHLFVSFAIRMLRKQAGKFIAGIKQKEKSEENKGRAIVPASTGKQKVKLNMKWGIGKFVLSGMVAYVDGRLCRHIPNAIVRRIVSGFLLSFLDNGDKE
ncbi:Vacuolar protein sorting-associated protein 13 domain [Macleaya cordata]|uniref:Vacuolar protein sorting-associated protein 13 domain n=1 Tax=Macleaya cordata TaxID=56857 RepID=A0A200R7A2_MACCD|nr:Vacuolar protein sorting-associated protein 13 domain [Macleaya cordata]